MNDTATLSRQMADTLLTTVERRWFDAAPRVSHWHDTIRAAYAAKLDGDCGRVVRFPADATTRDGLSYDEAGNVLEAFNDWLGRDIVYEVYDFVAGEEA